MAIMQVTILFQIYCQFFPRQSPYDELLLKKKIATSETPLNEYLEPLS